MPYLIIRCKTDYKVFTLSKDITTIGRAQDRDILLDSPASSREHAYIKKQKNGKYVLFDGGVTKRSSHGTFVNGKEIKKYKLVNNTKFRITDHYFTFMDRDESDPLSVWDVIQEEREPASRVVIKDADTEIIPSEFSSDSFSPLLNVVETMFLEMDRSQLRKSALNIVLKAIEAARGMVMLNKGNGILSVWSKQGFEKDSGDLKISQSSVEQVIKNGDAVLIHDEIKTLPKSVLKYDLNSVLCVPLQTARRIIGCIYLDNQCNRASFTPEDLKLLKFLACQIAAAMDKKEEEEYNRLEKQARDERDFVVQSDNMLKLFGNIKKMARWPSPVLILGEPGTGKELVARKLHELSPRKEMPFIPVNCAAINDNLFESELFGHIKGAFSGADKDKKGYFEIADGGTIFLDEIAEMSPGLQAKLLRVLQEQEINRVGDTRSVKINVRVVAATNKDISDESLRKKIGFREDLFGRLEGIIFFVPPLRKRPDDILPLAHHFLRNFAKKNHLKRIPGIVSDVMTILRQYRWPRNVRELELAVDHGAMYADGGRIQPEHLPTKLLPKNGGLLHIDKFHSLEDMEREHIIKALKFTDNNKTKAAELLGISRDRLLRMRNKFKIEEK